MINRQASEKALFLFQTNTDFRLTASISRTLGGANAEKERADLNLVQ